MSWKNESKSHSLASKGVKTTHKARGAKKFDWKKDFEDKSSINYSYRNITVGDEEETRLLENIPAQVVSFIDEGMNERDAKSIHNILLRIESGKIDYWGGFQFISKILEKYISAPKLEEEDFSMWETFIFYDLEDIPYHLWDMAPRKPDGTWLYSPDKDIGVKEAEEHLKQITKKLERGEYQ